MAQPSEEQLLEVAKMLTLGIVGPASGDHDASRRVNEWVQLNKGDPVFNTCLSYIATSPQSGVSGEARQQAALALKNSTVQMFEQAVRPNLATIQERLLVGAGAGCGLCDAHDGTRKAVASCISDLARVGGLASWHTLMPGLWAQLRASANAEHRAAILVCLRNICEDCTEQLDTPGLVPGQPALAEGLIPELVALLSETQAPREVELTLDSLYVLLDSPMANLQGSSIAAKCRAMLQTIFTALGKAVELSNALGNAGNVIKRNALRCFRMLQFWYTELKQMGALQHILPLIYNCTNAEDHDVALAACEFWGDLVTDPTATADLKDLGLLHQLLEQLLNKMVYSDMEVAMIMDEEQRDNVNPPKRRGKGRHFAGQDEDDDNAPVEQWTLRKCAASTLDQLSNKMRDEVITPPGQPAGWLLTTQIQARMQHADWKLQESAILALGAIANGCTHGIQPHLPGFIEFLLTIVADTSGARHFLVRSISCWTLSRFDAFIVRHQGYEKFFDRYLVLLLGCLTDPRRKVQECAVSAFAEFVDQCGHDLCEPKYLDMIVQKVQPCFVPGGYTTRNLVILLDAVGNLVRTAGSDIATPTASQYLFTPLIRGLFPVVKDDDYNLMPQLLLCIFNVIHGLGLHFAQYVDEVFIRVLGIIGQFFQEQWKYSEKQLSDPPDSDTCYYALDVVGAMVGALEGQHERLAALFGNTKFPGTDFTVFQLAMLPYAQPALACDKHIKMAGMGFLGECLRRFPELTVVPAVEQVGAILADCKDDDDLCNDCCWFVGETSLVLVQPFIDTEQARKVVGVMANVLVPILVAGIWHENLLQNCAIAVGRFGLVQPQLMASQLASFIAALCMHLSGVRDTNEKEQGFLGVCRMLQQGGFTALEDGTILRAVLCGFSSFKERSVDVTNSFVAILGALKKAVPQEEWGSVRNLVPSNFPQDLQRHM